MRKTLIVLMMILLPLSLIGKEISFFSYSSLDVPIKSGKDFTFDWLRIGFKKEFSKKFFASATYDLATDQMSFGYVGANTKVSHGTLTLLAGQFLNPIAYTFAAPKTIPITRWPMTLNSFSLVSKGIYAQYDNYSFTARAAHYNNGSSASLIINKLGLFWEQDVGYGGSINIPISSIKTKVGMANKREETYSFFRVKLPVINSLSFISQVDYLKGINKSYYLSGFTYEYSKNSFLKTYYDTKADRVDFKITYSF